MRQARLNVFLCEEFKYGSMHVKALIGLEKQRNVVVDRIAASENVLIKGEALIWKLI